ncbi:MAG: helix-turn-helix domain-containing protein [bacterium]|nr:helix-turn-helix domain-containing protein [bacterium]
MLHKGIEYSILKLNKIIIFNFSNKMENIVRVSVSEAAKLFGVSTKTIRLAIKNEELKYIVVAGRYKINFLSLIEWSQQSTRRRNQLSQQGIGQYIDKWKINNKKYSPSIKLAL